MLYFKCLWTSFISDIWRYTNKSYYYYIIIISAVNTSSSMANCLKPVHYNSAFLRVHKAIRRYNQTTPSLCTLTTCSYMCSSRKRTRTARRSCVAPEHVYRENEKLARQHLNTCIEEWETGSPTPEHVYWENEKLARQHLNTCIK